MIQKKHSFTLVEILLVVIALGIIASISSSFFNSRTQEKILFGEACLNSVHGSIRNYISDINYGKTTSGVITNTLQYYQVRFGTGQIELGEVLTGTNIFAPDKIFFLGSGLTNGGQDQRCKHSQFSLITNMQPAVLTVSIPKKGETLPSKEPGEWILGSNNLVGNAITGSVDFFVCDKPIKVTTDKSCIGVAKILIDKRSKQTSLHKCTTRDTKDRKCISRPSGF